MASRGGNRIGQRFTHGIFHGVEAAVLSRNTGSSRRLRLRSTGKGRTKALIPRIKPMSLMFVQGMFPRARSGCSCLAASILTHASSNDVP